MMTSPSAISGLSTLNYQSAPTCGYYYRYVPATGTGRAWPSLPPARQEFRQTLPAIPRSALQTQPQAVTPYWHGDQAIKAETKDEQEPKYRLLPLIASFIFLGAGIASGIASFKARRRLSIESDLWMLGGVISILYEFHNLRKSGWEGLKGFFSKK